MIQEFNQLTFSSFANVTMVGNFHFTREILQKEFENKIVIEEA